MAETEREAARLRAHRVAAEEAADAVETAWRLAGLPSEPGVMPVTRGSGLGAGPHVSLGGCSVAAARALAEVLTEYTRLTGRLVDGRAQRVLARVLAEHGVRPALPGDGAYVVLRGVGA
ncbi:hypothetical protein [Kitasatospora phosalacinea]|uniref:Uncharacterized protein n=1 Tax=Kitasatospora phosalacinea TaxID=2065 RepID=A0A9W6PG06_9ACTN|nr:hypothetical protein [Kitasatospora phosalacinea]GLW55370.1 hypothetical protein Kpho01_33810 [Kitasatospora phosalacinea]